MRPCASMIRARVPLVPYVNAENVNGPVSSSDVLPNLRASYSHETISNNVASQSATTLFQSSLFNGF